MTTNNRNGLQYENIEVHHPVSKLEIGLIVFTILYIGGHVIASL